MPRKVILFISICLSILLFIESSEIQVAQRHDSIDDHAILKDTVSIIGVGDIMMGSNYPDNSTLPPEDGRYLFTNVDSILRDADVTMGNLEGVLLDKGGYAKTCRDPKVCYVFRSPERYVDNLVNAGFDVMSLANNHAGDFGSVGSQSTIKTLEASGLHHAGQLARRYTTFERDSITYGFIAFAPNNGCVNINDLATARKLVQHLDSTVDIVIVSFHGGAEGPQHQHVSRKTEIFYGENRGNVFEFAHALIDAGADVVLGHGPHVVRAVEVYKDRFVAYSLGNFCTYGGINVSGINGFAPIIKVSTNNKGAFYQAKITACIQQFMSPVKVDDGNLVIDKIRELTKSDFPESTISISDDGWIRKSTN